jgi:hypothetical protein
MKMDDKLDDTLGELGGLMHRAALLRTEMTNDEYLNYVHRHGDGPQFMYEQFFGAVAILCMNGHTPDDIVPALIRHAVELAVMSYDDEREEARQLLTKNMDKYLALEGVQRNPSFVLFARAPTATPDS